MRRFSMHACLLVGLGCAAEPSRDASWLLVGEHPSALMSVWGTSERDVWITGARPAQGDPASSPTVLRYGGDAIERVETGFTGFDLWSVFGAPNSNAVFFAGSNGTILRFHAGQFERQSTPRSGLLFGLWGASENDLWAVGDGGSSGGIVFRYDGATWREQPLPSGVPSQVFKIDGRAADDVWIACAGGVVLHWNGTTLDRLTTGVTAPLFSIAVTRDGEVAVGGQVGIGHVMEHDASGWADSSLSTPAAWRGVASRDDVVWAVGEAGLVAKRDDDGWQLIDQDASERAFHAAWIDPRGGLWGVGGDFDRIPRSIDGFVTYYGADDPGTLPP